MVGSSRRRLCWDEVTSWKAAGVGVLGSQKQDGSLIPASKVVLNGVGSVVNRWSHCGGPAVFCGCVCLRMHCRSCSLRGAAAGILTVTALPQQCFESRFLPSVFSGLLWLIMLINDFAALHHLLAGLQARSTRGQAAQSFRNCS